MRELVAEFDPNAVALCEAPAMWQALAIGWSGFAATVKVLLAGAGRSGRRMEAQRATGRQREQLAADAGTSITAAQRAVGHVQAGGRAAEDGAGVAGRVSCRCRRPNWWRGERGRARRGRRVAATSPSRRRSRSCERHVLRTKAAVNVDESYARIRKERSARHYTDAEERLAPPRPGPLDDGGAFVRLFEGIIDELFKQRVQGGPRRPTSRLRLRRAHRDGPPRRRRRPRRTEDVEDPAAARHRARRPRRPRHAGKSRVTRCARSPASDPSPSPSPAICWASRC